LLVSQSRAAMDEGQLHFPNLHEHNVDNTSMRSG